jgi:hypothetical protein
VVAPAGCGASGPWRLLVFSKRRVVGGVAVVTCAAVGADRAGGPDGAAAESLGGRPSDTSSWLVLTRMLVFVQRCSGESGQRCLGERSALLGRVISVARVSGQRCSGEWSACCSTGDAGFWRVLRGGAGQTLLRFAGVGSGNSVRSIPETLSG